MTLDLAAVVLRFGKGLQTLDQILDKAVSHCAAQGIDQADMLEWRLALDMFPLRSQLQFVPNLASQWAARAAGVDAPPEAAGDMDIGEIKEAIGRARTFIESLEPERFAGRDSIPLTVSLGEFEPTMPIGQWIAGFATTNFYFHLSTAYGIMRANGVPLGKRDLFAGGL